MSNNPQRKSRIPQYNGNRMSDAMSVVSVQSHTRKKAAINLDRNATKEEIDRYYTLKQILSDRLKERETLENRLKKCSKEEDVKKDD